MDYLRVDERCYSTTGKCLAADEIARLRAEVERLTKERDEARNGLVNAVKDIANLNKALDWAMPEIDRLKEQRDGYARDLERLWATVQGNKQ